MQWNYRAILLAQRSLLWLQWNYRALPLVQRSALWWQWILELSHWSGCSTSAVATFTNWMHSDMSTKALKVFSKQPLALNVRTLATSLLSHVSSDGSTDQQYIFDTKSETFASQNRWESVVISCLYVSIHYYYWRENFTNFYYCYLWFSGEREKM